MSFTPTPEQDEAVAVFNTRKDMKIRAVAGSGKTSTLKLMGRSTISPGYYLCFNKDIATESAKTFPENVMCKTTHSLAWREVARKYKNDKDKMMGSLRARDVAAWLSIKDFPIFGGTDFLNDTTIGYAVARTVARFCQSADREFGRHHFEVLPKFKTLPDEEFLVLRARVVSWAEQLWHEMINPLTAVPLGHDGYVKAWQLSDPTIEAVFVLVDEFQDTAPVLLDVLKRQDCQIVGVGDENQQIYEWRGAINAMELYNVDKIVTLSKSFRFGQAIADFASDALATIGCDYRITGNENVESRLTDEPQPVVICRTNASILDQIIDLAEFAPDKLAYVCGGVEDLTRCLTGVEALQANKASAYAAFIGFKKWDEYTDYSEKSGDIEAQKIVKLVKKYGANKLKRQLENVLPSESKADIILTTAHKSKGREWPGVMLADDFKVQPEKDMETKELVYNKPETRLFYVAATRAMNQLKVPAWAKELYVKESDHAV